MLLLANRDPGAHEEQSPAESRGSVHPTGLPALREGREGQQPAHVPHQEIPPQTGEVQLRQMSVPNVRPVRAAPALRDPPPAAVDEEELSMRRAGLHIGGDDRPQSRGAQEAEALAGEELRVHVLRQVLRAEASVEESHSVHPRGRQAVPVRLRELQQALHVQAAAGDPRRSGAQGNHRGARHVRNLPEDFHVQESFPKSHEVSQGPAVRLHLLQQEVLLQTKAGSARGNRASGQDVQLRFLRQEIRQHVGTATASQDASLVL